MATASDKRWAEGLRRQERHWEAVPGPELAREVRRLLAWLFWISTLTGDVEASVWADCALAGDPAPQTVEHHPWWLVPRWEDG